MASPTYEETSTLESTADLGACRVALEEAFLPPARVERSGDATFEVTAGSRIAYRLFGVLLGADVPVKLRFELGPQDAGTRVKLTMRSDAGWYLFGTSIAEQAYQRRFAEVLTRLEQRGFKIVT